MSNSVLDAVRRRGSTADEATQDTDSAAGSSDWPRRLAILGTSAGIAVLVRRLRSGGSSKASSGESSQSGGKLSGRLRRGALLVAGIAVLRQLRRRLRRGA